MGKINKKYFSPERVDVIELLGDLLGQIEIICNELGKGIPIPEYTWPPTRDGHMWMFTQAKILKDECSLMIGVYDRFREVFFEELNKAMGY